MGSFSIGDFALVLGHDSVKVVLLKSCKSGDMFSVSWFGFAQEIASYYPNENLPEFDECELLYLVDNDFPKLIDTSMVLRNCYVQYVSSDGNTHPKNCSMEKNSFFVRFGFDGLELTELPSDLLNVSTTPQRKLTKFSKKIVRVSFAGINGNSPSPKKSPVDSLHIRTPMLIVDQNRTKDNDYSDDEVSVDLNPRSPRKNGKKNALIAISPAHYAEALSPHFSSDVFNHKKMSKKSPTPRKTDMLLTGRPIITDNLSPREILNRKARKSGLRESPAFRFSPNRLNESPMGKMTRIDIKESPRTPKKSDTTPKTPKSIKKETPISPASINGRETPKARSPCDTDFLETPRSTRQSSRTPNTGSENAAMKVSSAKLNESRENSELTRQIRKTPRTPVTIKQYQGTPETPPSKQTRKTPRTPVSITQYEGTPDSPLSARQSRTSKTPHTTRETRKTPRTPVSITQYEGTPDSPLSTRQSRTSKTPLTTRETRKTTRTPVSITQYEGTPDSPLSTRQSRTSKTPSSSMKTGKTPKTPVALLKYDETPESSARRQPARTSKTPITIKQYQDMSETPPSKPTRKTPRTPVSITQYEGTPETPPSTRQTVGTSKTPNSSVKTRKTPRTPVAIVQYGGTPESSPTRRQPARTSKTPIVSKTRKTPKTPVTITKYGGTPDSPVSAKQSGDISKTPVSSRKSRKTPKIPVFEDDDSSSPKPLSGKRKRRGVKDVANDLAQDSDEEAMEVDDKGDTGDSENVNDKKEDGTPQFRRSTRACKTAALKALLTMESSILVTHTFPGWPATTQDRKKVFGRRHSAFAGRIESPLFRVRRLQLEDNFVNQNLNKQLAGFRRSHRRTGEDRKWHILANSSDDEDEYLPSDADSDSDFEDPRDGRKRRAARGPKAKRRREDEEEDSVALPVRKDEGLMGERKTQSRGCKIRLVEHGKELEEAKLRLHVANLRGSGQALTCREEEFEDIYRFVASRLRDNETEDGGCMYISGLPGTGKTATVTAVVAALRSSNFPEFDLVEVNGMRLTDPQQVYPYVLLKLTGTRCTAKHAPQMLDKEFRKKARRPCLLIVDELDLLCTRRQQVLYNLFDWPQRASSRLTVLAIANTMDLPERLLHQKVASRLGLTRLVFQPYSHQQLHCIVNERLSGLNCFQKEALELTSRKVAAISGDARRALDICRRAAELAEVETSRVVNLKHVDSAIKEMFASSKVRAISECSVYEQMCLRALLAELSRTGLEEAQLDRVLRQMETLCRCEGVPLLTGGEVFTVMVRLASHKLLLCEHFRQDGKMKVRLNCAQHDVTFSLKDVNYTDILTRD